MGDAGELSFDWTPTKTQGVANVTARVNGKVIEYKRLDLSKPEARTNFANSVAKKTPAIDASQVEEMLLGIVDELCNPDLFTKNLRRERNIA